MESKKIFEQIPKIMQDLPAIGKDGKNSFQKYNFRGIDQMYNVIQPIMTKHKVFCAPQVIESKTEIYQSPDKKKSSFRTLLKINHRFYAVDGSFVEVITQGEGIDTSDKASNKAMSAAMKYAFIELFSIPVDDVADADKDHPEVGMIKSVSGADAFGF